MTDEIWEYVESGDEILSCDIYSKIQAPQTGNLTTDLDFDYNQIIRIYDDNDVLGFEGLITEKIIHEYCKEYNCISFGREVLNKKFSEKYSTKTAKQIIQDFIDDNCSYIYRSSSIDPDGDFTATYDIEFKNCSVKEALDTLADLEDAIWWIEPNGKLWMKKFSSLTACGDTIDETTGNVISIPKLTILSQTYNKVTIYGAINPATGTPWKTSSGHGEDLESQSVNGIVEYIDYYPQIHTQADIDAMSDALVARTGMVNNPYTINLDIEGLDFVQVGLTIDFSYNKPGFDDYIAANDTYVIIEDKWNAKTNNHNLKISTGIIQGKEQGKSRNIRTMASDEEQIGNLAEIVNDLSAEGSLAFKTINCPAGTDPVADSYTDTLNITSGNTKLTITGNETTDTVDFTINEGNIDHNALSNYLADKHIAHSAVSIIAGTGMSGGGTIAASRTLNCSITQYTDALAKAAAIEAGVYGAGWNGNTMGATKDAIYDKIETLGADNLGNHIATQALSMNAYGITSNDADITNQFGRCGLGSPYTDYAYFAHRDCLNTSDYAICQSPAGYTYLNSKAGQAMSFREGNVMKMVLENGKFGFPLGTTINEFSIDGTLTGNSNDAVPTEQAVKTALNAKVSDAVYGAGWNGVTTIAPSKNAVYDKIETLDGIENIIVCHLMAGSNGFVISPFYKAAWVVLCTDVDARLAFSFFVKDGGSFKFTMIMTTSANNAGKTASGKIYESDDIDGNTEGWDINGANFDIALQNNGVIDYPEFGTAFDVADNSIVGINYIKDDNAEGAGGGFYVYGAYLTRQ